MIGFGADFENSQQAIAVEIAVVDVTLRTMQSKMRGPSKKAVKKLRTSMRKYSQGPDRERFYLMYTEMQRVVEEVKELQKELSLE